jgi:hypothetical protein
MSEIDIILYLARDAAVVISVCAACWLLARLDRKRYSAERRGRGHRIAP